MKVLYVIFEEFNDLLNAFSCSRIRSDIILLASVDGYTATRFRHCSSGHKEPIWACFFDCTILSDMTAFMTAEAYSSQQ